MKNTGYTRNWRSIWFNELFQNVDGSYRSDYIAAWSWMISEAQFKTNGIGRGQLRCSEALLAKMFFCSKRRKARTFRATCAANNMLIWDPQPGQQMAIVTICNYEKYQGSETENDQESDQQALEKRPTKRPLLEEVKKEEEEENTSIRSDLIERAFQRFLDFADYTKLPKPRKLTPERKRKISSRLKTFTFDEWEKALAIAAKSEFILSSSWFGIDWLTKNDVNLGKVLEGNFDNKAQQHQESQEEIAANKFLQKVKREHADQPLPMPANGGSLLS